MKRREFLALPMVAAGARPVSYGEEFPDMLLLRLSKGLNALAARWDRE